MRQTLSVLLRLVMMSGFFLGLFWLVRAESFWKILAGASLILSSVPLADWFSTRLVGPDSARELSFIDYFKRSAPIVVPILLVLLMLSGLFYFHRSGDARIFFLYLFTVPPLLKVLIEARNGELTWQIDVLADAYLRLTLKILILAIVPALYAILAIGVGVLGSITLIMTVGDFLWHWVFSAEPLKTPVLCQLENIGPDYCASALTAWHGLTLLTAFIALRYGRRISDFIISWIAKL